MTFSKGDRVRFTVMFNDGQGHGRAHIVHRPFTGRVTSTKDHPRRGPVVRIAVDNPKPGSARYVERTVADVTPVWQQAEGDIPTWELTADPSYYVEKWGLGSWAAYHGDVAIGEPGTYGTRDEAQAEAEKACRQEGDADRDRADRFADQLRYQGPEQDARLLRKYGG